MVAKVASDQAKPNGVLWVLPGSEARFLAPLDVRKIPGVGKVTEQNLAAIGIRKVGDLAGLDEKFLAERFGQWGLALAGKSRGLDAGGWFDTDVGERVDPKSISHEHTYNVDTSDAEVLEATLLRLSEMVGRRLREHSLFARRFSSSCVTRTSRRSRELVRSTTNPDRRGDLRAGPRADAGEPAGWAGNPAIGCERIRTRSGRGTNEPARRTEDGPLAQGAIGDGPDPR